MDTVEAKRFIVGIAEDDLHTIRGTRHVPARPLEYRDGVQRRLRRKQDVLVIPKWCWLADLHAQIPPEEDEKGNDVFERDYFILHAVPPSGIYQGPIRLRIDCRPETLEAETLTTVQQCIHPEVTYLGHVWHPNIDMEGRFSKALLERFAVEANEGRGGGRPDWSDCIVLSMFLLKILAMFLCSGEGMVRSSQQLASLQGRLKSMDPAYNIDPVIKQQAEADQAKLLQLCAKLEVDTGIGSFFVDSKAGCAPLIMNKKAAIQLGYQHLSTGPKVRMTKHMEKMQRKKEQKRKAEDGVGTRDPGALATMFDVQAKKMLESNMKHEVHTALPHQAARWIGAGNINATGGSQMQATIYL